MCCSFGFPVTHEVEATLDLGERIDVFVDVRHCCRVREVSDLGNRLRCNCCSGIFPNPVLNGLAFIRHPNLALDCWSSAAEFLDHSTRNGVRGQDVRIGTAAVCLDDVCRSKPLAHEEAFVLWDQFMAFVFSQSLCV